MITTFPIFSLAHKFGIKRQVLERETIQPIYDLKHKHKKQKKKKITDNHGHNTLIFFDIHQVFLLPQVNWSMVVRINMVSQVAEQLNN